MEVIVLGTAAGGGFPQWNCVCPNCTDARAGQGGLLPRMQSSIAIRGAGGWHVVNASPDITRQIELFLPAGERNRIKPCRSAPVASVLVTNADLDHCLGLYLLREGEELRVTAPDGVRSSLIGGLHLDDALGHYNGIRWVLPSTDWMPADSSGLEVRAVELDRAEPPRYDIHSSHDQCRTRCHGVGYQFRSGAAGPVLGVFPDVGWMDQELLGRLDECDTLFFDGTFWKADEMPALGMGTRDAFDMGHVPMSGSGGSIRALSQLETTGIYFMHINNTNPVLRPDSPERQLLHESGMRLAEDGMRLSLTTPE